MGLMAQLALSNFLVFALAAILIIYIIYLFIKRAVEKNDGDYTLEAKERYRGANFKKFIFTFLYSAMTACCIYLMDSDKTGAIINFFIFIILGLLTPGRTREPKPSKTKMGKFFRYIVVPLVLLFLLVFLTVTSTASIYSKVGAWLILILIYPLEKIEKKYFKSDSTSIRL